MTLSGVVIGAGVTPALAAVAKPNASAALNTIDLIMVVPYWFVTARSRAAPVTKATDVMNLG